jgi:hypothetical protein
MIDPDTWSNTPSRNADYVGGRSLGPGLRIFRRLPLYRRAGKPRRACVGLRLVWFVLPI